VAAPPGEFTRRAFLNGRLTLDQAEAVADLIQAGSEQAARAAVAQLRGGLDAELGAIEWPLLDLLVRLEGSLEFSDDDDAAAVPPAETRLTLEEARDGINALLDLAPAGRLLREGIHVALVGSPNAGKSSLFNRLVGSDRALVDAEPGTTRDIVTAQVRRGGRLYVLHDTAGLRDTSHLRDASGRVETMGIARAREAASQADLVLLLAEAGVDGTPPWPELVADDPAAASPPVLRVLTKADLVGGGLAPAQVGGDADGQAANPFATSSLTGAGVDDLWAAIEHQVAAWRLDEAASLGVVLNERHRQRLLECRDELNHLLGLYDGTAPGDEVAGTLLASLLARLGEISGRVFTEQMLDGVFRRFCVGK
jgi:tRNA modification GTPase